MKKLFHTFNKQPTSTPLNLRPMGKLDTAIDKWENSMTQYWHFGKALTYQAESTNEKLKVRYQLGRVYESLGRIQDAIECYQYVHKVDPEYVDITSRLGLLSKRKKQSSHVAKQPPSRTWLGGALSRMQQKLRASQ